MSAEARARLARPSAAALRLPPVDDLEAVARWRDGVHRAWLDGDPSAERCGHREEVIGGVRVLRTSASGPGPLVVYLHGGGFALGSPEVAMAITERLAGHGLEVVSVDYRLAPEHPCPAAIDDAVAVCRALDTDTGGTGRGVVLAGDSAGANLALSAALRLRGRGESAVTGLLLLSPHVDHRSGRPTDGNGTRPTDLDRDGAAWLRDAYRGALPTDHLLLSPLWASLRGLPPILIQVGSIDTSFEHAVRLARLSRLAGVEVVLDVWEGLWHTWHYHRDLPEADRAISEAATFALRLSVPGA